MNQKTLNQLVGLCCFLLAANTGFSQPVTKHAFSLKDCVEFSHKNNVQVKNALLNVQIQKQINKDITAAAMPTISANIGGNDYLKIPTSLLPGEIFGQPSGSYIPVQFGTKFNANAGIALQQLLFDGQVFVGLRTRNTTIEFQNKNVEVTEELIKTNVYKIYYQLVASKLQITIFDANLERLNKLKANNSIEIGYLGLKTLIGMPSKDTLELTDALNENLLKDDLGMANDFKYQDRKDYQYLGLAKKLNEFNIQRYQLIYLPTLALNGNYSKNAQRKQFDFFGKGDWFSTSFIGLNLNIPIFSGFSKDAKLQKSRFELKQTENQISNMQLSIDAEIEGAKMVFRAAIATLGFQKQNMQLAENVYNQTKKKFELGTGSNTEITAAQTDLRTAQTNYISALYSAIAAKIDYTKAIGKL